MYAGTERWTPYLIGGSGTAAGEEMITYCVERGPWPILENGYYSGRLPENRERGFALYGCKGVLPERFFQVSNMGEVTDAPLDA